MGFRNNQLRAGKGLEEHKEYKEEQKFQQEEKEQRIAKLGVFNTPAMIAKLHGDFMSCGNGIMSGFNELVLKDCVGKIRALNEVKQNVENVQELLDKISTKLQAIEQNMRKETQEQLRARLDSIADGEWPELKSYMDARIEAGLTLERLPDISDFDTRIYAMNKITQEMETNKPKNGEEIQSTLTNVKEFRDNIAELLEEAKTTHANLMISLPKQSAAYQNYREKFNLLDEQVEALNEAGNQNAAPASACCLIM